MSKIVDQWRFFSKRALRRVFREPAPLLLAALSLTSFDSASSQSQPAWADSFQSAVSKLRAGETAGAMQCFNILWQNNSSDAQLATWIGASLDSTSHHKEATPWYQRSLAIRADFEPALNDLALNYATLGEFSKAQALLRQAFHVNPSNASAAYNLGLVDLHLNDYKDAASVLQRARESGRLGSTDQLVLAEATARFHLGEYERTASLLESAVGDRNDGYFLLLGSAQALSGDLPAAVKTLQSAVNSAPSDPQAYYRLALVFMLGRLDREAQDVLASGLKQIQRSPLLLFGQAVGSDAQGKLDDAAASVKQSLDANPRQAQAWALLGRLYAEMSRPDDAVEAYEHAVTLGAGVEVGVDRIQLLIRLQHFQEAEAELRVMAKQYPDNGKVDRGFGKLYREERRYDLAEKYLRHAILLDPGDADAHFALAEVLRLTHRPDEARREFATFREKKPAPDAKRLLELAAISPG